MAEDFESEPAAGGDPSPTAPGAVPHETDPGLSAMSEPEPSADGARPRATNAGRVWFALGVATVLLVLLIIFIAENSRSVTISFLGAHGHISLALALLIAAVVGVAVTLLAGTARILQLRHEVRRTRSPQGRRAMTPRHGVHPR